MSCCILYRCIRWLGLCQQHRYQPAPEPGGQAVCSTDLGSEGAPVPSGCGWNEWWCGHKVRCYAWEALCAAGWESCLQGENIWYGILFYVMWSLLLLSRNRVIRSNTSRVGVKVPTLSVVARLREKEQWKKQHSFLGTEPGWYLHCKKCRIG